MCTRIQANEIGACARPSSADRRANRTFALRASVLRGSISYVLEHFLVHQGEAMIKRSPPDRRTRLEQTPASHRDRASCRRASSAFRIASSYSVYEFAEDSGVFVGSIKCLEAASPPTSASCRDWQKRSACLFANCSAVLTAAPNPLAFGVSLWHGCTARDEANCGISRICRNHA
jgi:hypothetical protein